MIKVAFITCVSDLSIYKQCLKYLALLNKDGFSVEYIPVKDDVSITRAYNKAMRSSSAKYKVYLHQDTFIVERMFLHQIHKIFSSDPGIGMIGLLGGRKMPLGDEKYICWSECREIFGCCYSPKFNFSVKGLITNKPYEWVTVADGFILITQHDIPWREDIIDGFHFYDKSQSLEFWKKNLKVVVPAMKNYWAYHLCNQTFNGEYYRLRTRFLNAYRQYLNADVKKKALVVRRDGKKYVWR